MWKNEKKDIHAILRSLKKQEKKIKIQVIERDHPCYQNDDL